MTDQFDSVALQTHEYIGKTPPVEFRGFDSPNTMTIAFRVATHLVRKKFIEPTAVEFISLVEYIAGVL